MEFLLKDLMTSTETFIEPGGGGGGYYAGEVVENYFRPMPPLKCWITP